MQSRSPRGVGLSEAPHTLLPTRKRACTRTRTPTPAATTAATPLSTSRNHVLFFFCLFMIYALFILERRCRCVGLGVVRLNGAWEGVAIMVHTLNIPRVASHV